MNESRFIELMAILMASMSKISGILYWPPEQNVLRDEWAAKHPKEYYKSVMRHMNN